MPLQLTALTDVLPQTPTREEAKKRDASVGPTAAGLCVGMRNGGWKLLCAADMACGFFSSAVAIFSE